MPRKTHAKLKFRYTNPPREPEAERHEVYELLARDLVDRGIRDRTILERPYGARKNPYVHPDSTR